jgi:hypothetical protein
VARLSSSAPRRPLSDRIALGVVVVATAWFACSALWGMFGLPGAGHLGSGTIASIASSEAILRWKVPWPSWDWYAATPPAPSSYACHHPYGVFYLPLPLLWALGHHDYVLALPGAILSVLSPPLLYGIAKERWGAPAGAVAAASYVVLPIVVGYSAFWGLEPVCISGALLLFWGHSRHLTTGKRRYLAVSLAGVLLTCSGDWIGYVIVAVPLAWGLLRGFLLPARLTPRFHASPYARWWALSVVIAVATLMLWVALFAKVDHLQDWLSAGTTRSAGHDAPLGAVLHNRANWVDFSFTPLAIFLGKVAAPVCLLRFLVARRDEELYAPALLAGAVGQYVVFKEGADVHFFWPLYFAPYYALALAQLAHAVARIGGAIASRLRRIGATRGRAIVAWACLVLGLAPTLAMARDGARALVVLRRTGGRYDNHGFLMRSDIDVVAVVEQVIVPGKTPGMVLDVDPGMGWYWHMDWAYAGKTEEREHPLAGSRDVARHPLWVARASGLSSEEQKAIAHDTHVRVFGDVWIVDQREPAAPLDAYSMNEREPGLVDWLLRGGTQRVRRAGATPDPWVTWEWRTQLGQEVQPPTTAPATLDQMRIAHNVAVALGDGAGAARWLDRIGAQLDRGAATHLDPGLTLVGTKVYGGAEPRLQSWFLVEELPGGDSTFEVRSVVEARAPFSLIPADTTARPMAFPGPLPTKLWKVGFLYVTEVALDHRIGRERYLGRWKSSQGWAPQRTDGADETTLAVVP